MINERFPYKVLGITVERTRPFVLATRSVFLGETVIGDSDDPVERTFPLIPEIYRERDDLPAMTEMLLAVRLLPEDLRQWDREGRLAGALQRYFTLMEKREGYMPITAVCEIRWPGRSRIPYQLRKQKPCRDVACYPRQELGLPSMEEGFEREREWRRQQRSADERGRPAIGT